MILWPDAYGRCRLTYCTDIQVLDELTDGHLLVYWDHLMAVKADMEVRFRDLDQLAVPNWVMEPLQHDAATSEEATTPRQWQRSVTRVGELCGSPMASVSLSCGRESTFCSSLSPHPILWSRASAKLCTCSQSTATA